MNLFALSCLALFAATVLAKGDDTFQASLTEKSGVTGLMLSTTDDDFPQVRWVLPNSPAALNGTLHPGDRIHAVRWDGTNAGWISTKGMDVLRVLALLSGPPGSEVSIKALVSTPNGQREEIVNLQRRQPIQFRLPNGEISWGFPSTNFGPVIRFESMETNRLIQHPLLNWLSVTNGMPASAVLQSIGHPLEVGRGREPDEVAWRYGCRVFVGKEPLPLWTVVVFMTNGVVAEALGPAPSPEAERPAEILSSPTVGRELAPPRIEK